MSPEPTNREIAAVARRAADIIQQRGKATGTAKDARGRVCAHGALGLAAAELVRCALDFGQPSLPFLIARHCCQKGWVPGRRADGLAAWNDLPTTTEADIAKVFLQAAADLEAAP